MYFMADEQLRAAVEVHAAARGVSVSAFLTATVSSVVNRGLREEVLLELTPSVKSELRKGQQAVSKELRPWLMRATFEASLVRMLLSDLHQRSFPEVPIAEVLRQLVPEAKERLRNPFFGLEEFAGRDEVGGERKAKQP
jgi:hypothetical protein